MYSKKKKESILFKSVRQEHVLEYIQEGMVKYTGQKSLDKM